MKIKIIILVGIVALGAVFLLTIKQSGNGANMTSKEQRAQQLAKQAKHLNGKQLLGFLSTYAEDEEEMEMALAILQGKDIPQHKQTASKPEKKEKITKITQEQQKEIDEALSARGVGAVNNLLKTMDVNAADKNGGTLLHQAVKYMRVDIAKLLLDKGANVNACLTSPNWYGATPLDVILDDTGWKLYYHLPKEAKEEILQGWKAERKSEDDPDTEVMMGLLELFLTNRAKSLRASVRKYTKDPELNVVVDMLELLLKHGAESGFVLNSNGHTLRSKDLSEQEWRERLQEEKKQKERQQASAQAMGQKGTDQNLPSNSTPNPEVTQPSSTDNSKIASQQTIDQFSAAILQGDIEQITRELPAIADINAVTESGQTFLQQAVAGHSTEVVELLLDAGADINATGGYGRTPLFDATSMGYIDIVRTLLAAKADVNARDEFGYTPLYVAIPMGHLETIKLLVANGADINTKDSFGNTPLHLAVGSGRIEIVQWLLENGANINAQNNQNVTPLQVAERTDYKNIVEFLKASGASVSPSVPSVQPKAETGAQGITKQPREDFHTTASKDISKDKQALQNKFVHLCRWGKIEELEQALAAGADVNTPDNFGNLPLKQAVLGDKTQHVELLLKHGATATPSVLKLAENRHNEEIINLLKSAGAKE